VIVAELQEKIFSAISWQEHGKLHSDEMMMMSALY